MSPFGSRVVQLPAPGGFVGLPVGPGGGEGLCELVRLEHELPGLVAPRAVPAASVAPVVLCYTAKQTAEALQISDTTLWRLEKTGRLVPLPDLRHKRYPVDWVQRYASGDAPHPAMVRLVAIRKASPKKAPRRHSYLAVERVPDALKEPQQYASAQKASAASQELGALTEFINKTVRRAGAKGPGDWDGKPVRARTPGGMICTFTWDIPPSPRPPELLLVSVCLG